MTKPKNIEIPFETLLNVFDKIKMGVTYSHLARSLGIPRPTLVSALKSHNLYMTKHKKKKTLDKGWMPVSTAPKDRTILGWVKKPAINIDGQVNRGYYCTVSWFGGGWDDGIDVHDISAWQELPEPPQ